MDAHTLHGPVRLWGVLAATRAEVYTECSDLGFIHVVDIEAVKFMSSPEEALSVGGEGSALRFGGGRGRASRPSLCTRWEDLRKSLEGWHRGSQRSREYLKKCLREGLSGARCFQEVTETKKWNTGSDVTIRR